MRRQPNTEAEADGPDDEDDAEFARQLGAVLRTSETPRPDFDERIRAAVRQAHATPSAATLFRLHPHAGFWRQPRSLSLSPIGWGALAAGLTAVIAGAGLAIGARTAALQQRVVAAAVASPASSARATVPARDTVYVVHFVLADTRARTVSLVGDFNAWASRATPLTSARPGVWTTQVALPAGRHEYAFVVDGKQWVADPSAERLRDEFNTQSSVVTVGRRIMD